MYHSITFGDKNTYDDWHLVPLSRPVFNPPTQKIKTVDIPGANGLLDFSDSLTKYPVFNNRIGSFEFAVLNGYEEWHMAYSQIMSYLHGKKTYAILEDDPKWMYVGRFSVNQWKSNNDGTWSNIVIDYDVEPYKLALFSSLDDWIWDPFNFDEDIILSDFCKDIRIDSDDYVVTDFTGIIGEKPIVPTFIVEVDNPGTKLYTKLWNSDLGIDGLELDLPAGTYQLSDFVLCEFSHTSSIQIGFKGHGYVSIDYRSGRL